MKVKLLTNKIKIKTRKILGFQVVFHLSGKLLLHQKISSLIYGHSLHRILSPYKQIQKILKIIENFLKIFLKVVFLNKVKQTQEFLFQLRNLLFLKIQFMLIRLKKAGLKLVCMMNFLRQILIYNFLRNKITQNLIIKLKHLIQKKNPNKNKNL